MKLIGAPADKRVLYWAAGISFAITAVIGLLNPVLDASFGAMIGEDQGGAWYYWQTANDPGLIGRLSYWVPYALHQIAVWFLIAKAMRERQDPSKLSRVNILFLAVNAFFILLHILQSHLFYNGLAKDVPIWSSQFSVIIMLCIMLFNLNPRRGLILGWKMPYSKAGTQVSNLIHGPYISWALVYTFWFHPTVGTWGLLFGFFYMFLLLTQMSVANTRLHLSIGWLTLLEFLVALHGPIIAFQNGYANWPMFASGFLFMTAFTQQFGFKLRPWARALVFAAYAGAVAWMYSIRGYERLYEVLFIPVALYGGAFAYSGLTALIGLLRRKGGTDAAKATA
jgi:hypothetical protein